MDSVFTPFKGVKTESISFGRGSLEEDKKLIATCILQLQQHICSFRAVLTHLFTRTRGNHILSPLTNGDNIS